MTEISNNVIGDRSLAAWEIVSVVSSVLITEWVVLSLAQGNKLVAVIPLVTAFSFMFLSHRLHGETLRDLGIRVDNLACALLWLAIPTILVVAVFVIAGWYAGGLRLDTLWSRPRYLLLPVWAFAQQYVTQGFINRRAQILFGRGWQSVLLVASIFALLHMPNLGLMGLTFVGGLVWAAAYQLTPNLLALALSHALTAMILATSLPSGWVRSLRIGLKYFL